ncbi:hypothetical protein GS501_04325 [Saccharibacter sp. 17.LH.SD]|uniref:hypothetical protein n=1 Tax=Saccharibacter sp. 17.LH.SD TaxID=2689393 RepID=UPI00136F4BF0|nr:hypothetical protein [Saccharibacter sp. 17.LH.SD]MXV44277.1 hypothetical protein [Saccharibacter sp. 17.LH.SD]
MLPPIKRKKSTSGWIFLTVLLASCSSSVGPHNMRRDRLDYEKEIGKQQNQEMLFNIVQLRYSMSPTLLQTSQIISGYSFSRNASANISGTPWNGAGASSFIGGSVGLSYSDNPTVTYQPYSGVQFANNVLRPITPAVLFPLILSGLPVDALLQLTMQSMGGASNTTSSLGGDDAHQASVRFTYLLRALKELQKNNALSILTLPPEPASKTKPAVPARSFLLLPKTANTELKSIQDQVRQSLQIPPNTEQAEIVYGQTASKPGQVAMITRSMLAIWQDIAGSMEVPQKLVDQGVVAPTTTHSNDRPAIIIHCSTAEPTNVYVSIKYEGYWYWVAKKDLQSKVAFSMLQFINALAETSTEKGALVTISAGGK